MAVVDVPEAMLSLGLIRAADCATMILRFGHVIVLPGRDAILAGESVLSTQLGGHPPVATGVGAVDGIGAAVCNFYITAFSDAEPLNLAFGKFLTAARFLHDFEQYREEDCLGENFSPHC